MDANDILPLIPDGLFDPTEVVLIGSHMAPSPELKPDQQIDESNMDETDRQKLRVGEMQLHCDFARKLSLVASPKMVEDEDGKSELSAPSVALIYAYGYEGHMYRLPKPRIMIVNGAGKPFEPTREPSSSLNLTGRLYMWRLSKHQQTVSIEVESGDLKTLVLDGNQPGNRAVNSYSAHMQMSHRGGKLS